MELLFEWDEEKAQSNLKKHKVGFEEGATIFHDLFVATMPDPDHSEDEQRYVSIGLSAKGRLLVVVHTERGNKTRIVSCRKATSREQRIYEEGDYY
jgi:uncharacterized DUF497 family protein